MSFEQRKSLYEKMSSHRKRPLVAYVTSGRPSVPGAPPAQGIVAIDSLPWIVEQLRQLPKGTKKVDLVVNSYGGDGLASWRIITMMREYLGEGCHLSCLVPHYAFSAATLMAVGCDEIVLHPLASLGPVDPQMTVAKKDGAPQQFAYQDVTAYTAFLQEEAGITEQKEKVQLISQLVNQIEPSAIGASKRASMQSIVMAQRLLKLHMKGEDATRADIIAEQLSKNYFSHGHAVSRSEAKELGLKIADRDSETEELLWSIYKDFENEMQMTELFNPSAILLRDPRSAPLLDSPPVANVPGNLPAPLAQQAWAQVMGSIGTAPGPTVDFALFQVAVESIQSSVRWVTRGKVIGFRQPDLNFRMSTPILSSGWEK